MQTGYSIFIPSFYLWRQIGGNWCGFMCCIAAATLWFYHGLNFAIVMLLFTIVFLHTSLILVLVFMVIWMVFLLKGLCRKLVLCGLVSRWYTCFVYAQILFCRTFQVKKKQHKQTRDLSSSNRGRLLNKMLWCLQIQEESLKTLLLGVFCLVVWNLLIHSLRWSKFIWIFNLLKR